MSYPRGMCKGRNMGPARGAAEKNRSEYLFCALPVLSYFLCLTSTLPSPQPAIRNPPTRPAPARTYPPKPRSFVGSPDTNTPPISTP